MATPNRFCSKCGAPIADATDSFCPKCGAPYAASVSATAHEPSPTEPRPVEPPPVEEPAAAPAPPKEPQAVHTGPEPRPEPATAAPAGDEPISLERKLFLFEGTLDRSTFIGVYILSASASWGLLLLIGVVGIVTTPAIVVLAYLVLIAGAVVSLSTSAARLRDIGESPWYVLVGVVPVVNLALAVVLFCTPTNNGRVTKTLLLAGAGIFSAIALVVGLSGITQPSVSVASALLIATGTVGIFVIGIIKEPP
jgi:uncharacterized membrane protein YhaH (DUF805 family)